MRGSLFELSISLQGRYSRSQNCWGTPYGSLQPNGILVTRYNTMATITSRAITRAMQAVRLQRGQRALVAHPAACHYLHVPVVQPAAPSQVGAHSQCKPTLSLHFNFWIAPRGEQARSPAAPVQSADPRQDASYQYSREKGWWKWPPYKEFNCNINFNLLMFIESEEEGAEDG